MDIYGLVVLLVVLLLTAALQVAAMFGMMYAMHTYFAEKIPRAPYGTFDFEKIDKTRLPELLAKLAAIFYPPTLLLHLLEFVTIGIYIRAYPTLISAGLVVLEAAAIWGGITFILKVDNRRARILASGSAAFYLILYVGLVFGYLRN